MSQLCELQLCSLQTITAPTIGAGVSVAAITGDFTLHGRVSALASGVNLRVAFEECANNFAGAVVNMASFSTVGLIGGLPQQADVVYSFRAREARAICMAWPALTSVGA